MISTISPGAMQRRAVWKDSLLLSRFAASRSHFPSAPCPTARRNRMLQLLFRCSSRAIISSSETYSFTCSHPLSDQSMTQQRHCISSERTDTLNLAINHVSIRDCCTGSCGASSMTDSRIPSHSALYRETCSLSVENVTHPHLLLGNIGIQRHPCSRPP